MANLFANKEEFETFFLNEKYMVLEEINTPDEGVSTRRLHMFTEKDWPLYLALVERAEHKP